MSELFEKCMLSPFYLDRQEVDVLILTMLAAIAEAVGLDDEEIFKKAKEAYGKL